MKISFCGKCGAELGVGTNFCPNCGWKLPGEEERNIIESLNELKHNNEESSAITPSASLTPQYIEEPSDVKKCINCETSLPHSAKFCKQCGEKQVEAVSTPEKWCIYCGNVMDPDDIFCSNCGANQNGDVEQQYFAQAVPVLDTPKKKSYGGLIAVLVSVLFIASIVGGVLIFGTGNVKAEEMNGIWSVGFTVTGMNDDMNYYDYSAYIGQTTESTLTVDLDEDGKGTARLVTTVGGIDYDYEVMNAQYNRGKLVCIADTASQNIEFTGNVRKKGDRYQLNGKFKMIFIEGEKITTSGKWTATKEIGQTADTAPGNSSKPNNTEDLPNLAVYATMLDIIGEWEGTATLTSFTGYEENRAFFLDNGAPEDFIEQFDNMKGKDSPIFLEIDDDYGWEVTVDVEPMGELSISDWDFGYDENDVEIDGKMKLENGRFQLANSERDGDIGSAAFNFSGSVLTNDDGSYALKGSLTLSMEFDAGTVPLEMVFEYDMLRSLNTED